MSLNRYGNIIVTMNIAVATATYYFLPFEQALAIIAGAGFEHIELDLYWEKGPWGMAEHLQGCSPREAARQIEAFGLHVATIHDGSGMMDGPQHGEYIHPDLRETLDAIGYAPGCIVFHPPCRAGAAAPGWWQSKAQETAQAMQAFAGEQTVVTMENLPRLAGYYVPITTVNELLDFVSVHDLGATLDVTHCAENGFDFIQAAKDLGQRLQSIHLSDFAAGRSHVFLGDGEMDFATFFRQVDLSGLKTLTLECSPGCLGEDPRQLDQAGFTQRLAEAKRRLLNFIG
jgi:sugar phosphate isomerase/epimerase